MTLYTPTYSLPYPQESDTPDVPRDVAALANAVDTQLASSVGSLDLGVADCRYTATANQSVTSAGAKLQFGAAPARSNTIVTASGTGNTDFQLNATGRWILAMGWRHATNNTSALHNIYTVLRRGTVEVLGDNTYYNFGTTVGFLVGGKCMPIYATSGDSFNVWCLPDASITVTPTGSTTFFSTTYLGP